jgi:cobalt-precorrin-5B (C1)-methyltransferase
MNDSKTVTAESSANEHFIFSGTKQLRCGYTTGTCAALAAKAAVTALLNQKKYRCQKETFPNTVSIMTPKGWPQTADVLWPADSGYKNADCSSDKSLNTGIARSDVKKSLFGGAVRCGVKKDAGDDSDVTDGFVVYASVSLDDKSPLHENATVCIYGGTGVGIVTKPGLDQNVGEVAINHVPRKMIAREVRSVCAQYQFTGTVFVTIDVPGGKKIAQRTFNPQLGIEGGISILGTSGVVEPMSEQAIIDSIEVEIRQIAAEYDSCSGTADDSKSAHCCDVADKSKKIRPLIITPGNYGEDFIFAHPELKSIPVVKCSNFIGASLDYAVAYHFSHVLIVGHAGKLFKLAGGIMNTHSHVADCRLELIACHAALCGASQSVIKKIMECATVDAALYVLDDAGAVVDPAAKAAGVEPLAKAVVKSLLYAAQNHVSRRVSGAYECGIIMFTNMHGELGMSDGTETMIKMMN